MSNPISSPVLCIYHANCVDGFAAAWAVRRHYGPTSVDIEFHPGVYGENPPNVQDRTVVIVDFSYKRDVLLQMANAARSMLIIDHHISAYPALQDLPDNCEVVYDINNSGVVLTWYYFHAGECIPQLILHIQDRDLWEFNLEGTRDIIAELQSHPFDFMLWDYFMGSQSSLEEMRQSGAAINRHRNKMIMETVDLASMCTFAGWAEVPIVNVPFGYMSDVGNILAKGRAFAICFYMVGQLTHFALRSDVDGEDVSKIAERFGGGGHTHAAGFRVASDKVADLLMSCD